MDLASSLERLVAAFDKAEIDFALIGALALAAHGVPRATGDIDILVHGDHAAALDRVMSQLGYRCLHRTENVAQFATTQAQFGGVDCLFARRPYSVAMLARAARVDLGVVRPTKVLQVEDLIGLKVQSSSNDPSRYAFDLADIERLLRVTPDLDLTRVREYFQIFEREAELDRLMESVKP